VRPKDRKSRPKAQIGGRAASPLPAPKGLQECCKLPSGVQGGAPPVVSRVEPQLHHISGAEEPRQIICGGKYCLVYLQKYLFKLLLLELHTKKLAGVCLIP